MPVPSSIADLSTTANSNSPAGTEAIGTNLDNYLRSIQSIIKQENSKGTDITSSGTITVPSAGSYFVVTGTTTITAINDSWDGRTVAFRFNGILTFTHSSGLILPGSANITTAAGDTCLMVNESTGVWRCVAYQKASGAALVPADIGVTVQGYDADTTKNDVANTFTATQTLSKGADVASANALTLGSDGNYFDITGTTAITSIGTKGVGTVVKLHFDGALTLTHHATDLVLPSGANITTAAGDEAEFIEYATGDWRCTCYTKANGQSVSSSGGITLGTQVATTSGASIDFTSIPAGVKRITIMLNGVSTTGSSIPMIQIGDSGGVEATGYTSGAWTANTSSTSSTSGLLLGGTHAAGYLYDGIATLNLMDSASNKWAFEWKGGSATLGASFGAGNKALSATLDRVRLTTVAGSDTFDAGTMNISYE